MTPLDASCNPRWATARSVSQSSFAIGLSDDFERALDFDSCIRRQSCHTDRAASVPALIPESLDHEVGRAVHHVGAVGKSGCRIDETTQSYDARDIVEVAERVLELRQQVDRTGARGLLSILDRDARAQLSFCDQSAVGAKAKLPRDYERISTADEWDIVGDRACRCRQRDPQGGELLFDRTRHVVLCGLLWERSLADWVAMRKFAGAVAGISRGLYLAHIMQPCALRRHADRG